METMRSRQFSVLRARTGARWVHTHARQWFTTIRTTVLYQVKDPRAVLLLLPHPEEINQIIARDFKQRCCYSSRQHIFRGLLFPYKSVHDRKDLNNANQLVVPLKY